MNQTIRWLLPVTLLVACTVVQKTGTHSIGPVPKLQDFDTHVVALGNSLFHDTRLSRDQSLACVSCHRPELGFGDGRKVSIGLDGKALRRHAPSLYNLGHNQVFFWDGRAATLQEQAQAVIENADEFGMSMPAVIDRLQQVAGYREAFAAAFPGRGIDAGSVLDAIAAFVASIVVDDTPFDRFQAGDRTAMTESQQRGHALFTGRGKCITCHKGPNFTDQDFHHTGVVTNDLGRIEVVRNTKFQMRPYPFFANHKAFKTPGLRNVALSAPYFHDGSAATLEDVVDFYDKGGLSRDANGRSPEVHPLHLSAEERTDLIAFLHALTQPMQFAAPAPMR
jgi:cytochrome c peroxidase